MRTLITLRRGVALLGVGLVALTSSMLGAAFAGPAAQTFSDVPPSHTFYDEIEWLADSGITTGYPDGSFRPGAPVTRQAMAAYLQRLHAGITTHRTSVAFPAPDTVWEAVADCPAGTRAIAGGGAVNTGGIQLTDSKPADGNSGWVARFEVEPAVGAQGGVTVSAYVTCVPATPAG